MYVCIFLEILWLFMYVYVSECMYICVVYVSICPWLKSHQPHLLVEVASWLSPATQNTVLLRSFDLISVLNHTWLPFYQCTSSLFPWLTYLCSSTVDFFYRVLGSFFPPDSQASWGYYFKYRQSCVSAFWSVVAGALQGAVLMLLCWCCCGGKLRQAFRREQMFCSFSLIVFRPRRALVGGYTLRIVCAYATAAVLLRAAWAAQGAKAAPKKAAHKQQHHQRTCSCCLRCSCGSYLACGGKRCQSLVAVNSK